jgi:hypothetical protein
MKNILRTYERSETKYWRNRSESPVHAKSKIVQIPKIVQENPTVSGVSVLGTRQMEWSRDAGLLLQLKRSVEPARAKLKTVQIQRRAQEVLTINVV